MKVDTIEHNSQNTKSVRAIFTTKHISVLILTKYLASGVPLECVSCKEECVLSAGDAWSAPVLCAPLRCIQT